MGVSLKEMGVSLRFTREKEREMGVSLRFTREKALTPNASRKKH
jgi:hypothetical protein